MVVLVIINISVSVTGRGLCIVVCCKDLACGALMDLSSAERSTWIVFLVCVLLFVLLTLTLLLHFRLCSQIQMSIYCQ